MRTPSTSSTDPFRTRRWALIACAFVSLAALGTVGVARATSPDGATAYVPISPCRLADTRAGTDNVGGRATPLGPDEAITLLGRGAQGNCTGPAALPVNATGLQLNVTAVNATAPTFLTVYPSDVERPGASHLNPMLGAPPTPNAVTVRLDANGRFDVFNRFGYVDVIVDVVGFYADHHHDDRYYTRTQIDATFVTRAQADGSYYTRQEIDALVASFDRPWEVHIPGESLQLVAADTAAVDDRRLPQSGQSSLLIGTRVPAEVAGTDLAVVVTAFVGSDTPCTAALEATAYAARHGENVIAVPLEYVGPGFEAPDWGLYSIEGPYRAVPIEFRLDGAGLRPGDWVKIVLTRQGDLGPDMCTTSIDIVGATIRAA